jgi:hypothetical protein
MKATPSKGANTLRSHRNSIVGGGVGRGVGADTRFVRRGSGSILFDAGAGGGQGDAAGGKMSCGGVVEGETDAAPWDLVLLTQAPITDI